MISGNLVKYFYKGKLHRADGPAVCDDDYQEWYLYGKRHREDGPSINLKNLKVFHIDGETIDADDIDDDDNCTKLYGQFVQKIKTPVSLLWYQHGQLHREDGPAVEYSNGVKEYCFCGNDYTYEEYIELLKLDKL